MTCVQHRQNKVINPQRDSLACQSQRFALSLLRGSREGRGAGITEVFEKRQSPKIRQNKAQRK